MMLRVSHDSKFLKKRKLGNYKFCSADILQNLQIILYTCRITIEHNWNLNSFVGKRICELSLT